MAKYLVKRFLKALFTFFISITITFFVVRAMPSDPVAMMVDPKTSPEVQQAMIENLGLDKPLFTQYFIYLGDLMQGDLGTSFRTGKPVVDTLLQRLPWTILLVAMSMGFALLVGIPVGVVAARKKGSVFDNLTKIMTTVGVSIFIPFLSFGLLYLFATLLGWLPTGGAYTPPLQTGFPFLIDVLRHAVLPALALFITNVASVVMYTRNSTIDVLKEDYIRTAYAKGLSEKKVIKTHALKNAMIPTITITGITIGTMMGGAVMTETIFAWPGIGRLIHDSVTSLDYPTLQGAFIILAVAVIFFNIIADLMIAWLDPRIKLGV